MKYTNLVKACGFNAVMIRLELTATELHVLLTHEHAKVEHTKDWAVQAYMFMRVKAAEVLEECGFHDSETAYEWLCSSEDWTAYHYEVRAAYLKMRRATVANFN